MSNQTEVKTSSATQRTLALDLTMLVATVSTLLLTRCPEPSMTRISLTLQVQVRINLTFRTREMTEHLKLAMALAQRSLSERKDQGLVPTTLTDLKAVLLLTRSVRRFGKKPRPTRFQVLAPTRYPITSLKCRGTRCRTGQTSTDMFEIVLSFHFN